MTVTTATAARWARVTVRTIRAWCRRGLLAAEKTHGRWSVTVAELRGLLARLYPAPRPRPAGRHRKGEAAPVKTGRAARVRVGHHMSARRRHAVLDATVERANLGRITAAEYLVELGADEAFIRSYASPFGKAAKKAYVAAFGVEPAKSGLARVGVRLVPVFAYDGDEAGVLYEAAQDCRRTREFLAEQRSVALRSLAVA
jgi:hypothetical protein